MNQDQEWTNSRFGVSELSTLTKKTPFLLIDTKDVQTKYRTFKKYLPFVKVFYAVKCNPEDTILKVLQKEGCGFEIASVGEFERVKDIVDSSDIIFSNTIKQNEDIKQTHDGGVTRYAFDSISELKRLAKYAPGSQVFLRLAVSNYGSSIPLTKKFGAVPEEAVSLLDYAKKAGLIPIGLSFHVGSQAENLHVWDEAFEVCADVLKIAKKSGHILNTLDIGGGFPVRYSTLIPSIQDIAEVISSNIDKYKLQKMEFWAEPGRFLVAESGIIGATVISKVKRGNSNWLYLDVGRFNCFTELFESEDIRYPILSSRDTDKLIGEDQESMALTGPTCDSFDTIYMDALINKNVREGDKLYFSSAGAYTHVYGSTFNDFKIPDSIIS